MMALFFITLASILVILVLVPKFHIKGGMKRKLLLFQMNSNVKC